MSEYTVQDLQDNLNYINETKRLIKQAIIEKEQPVSEEDTFRSYAEKIKLIETGVKTDDATATADDIISPATAYVNGKKITGNIVANNEVLSGGMTYETANLAASYNVLDISENYDIALLGNYNASQFYVYKIEDNKFTDLILTLSNTYFGVSGTLMTAHIAQKINSLGNLNIFAQFHVDGNLNHTLCAAQLNPDTLEIVKKGSTTLYGKSLRGATHASSLAINPVYPGIVGFAFANSSTSNNFAGLVMQYNESTNSFSQKAAIGLGSPYPSTPGLAEWDKDGLVFHFGEQGNYVPNLDLIIKFNNTNFTSWTNINGTGGFGSKYRTTLWNKNYWFKQNSLMNMSGTVVKTYSEFSGSNRELIWTYDDYLFVANTSTGVLYCYRIDTSTLNLTLCFSQAINTTFPSSYYISYYGGVYAPACQSHMFYRDTGNTQLRFKFKDATLIPISMTYQYKNLYNTEGTTATAANLLSGRTAFTKDGKITGTMANRGSRTFTPSDSAQTGSSGYYSGITVKAMDITTSSEYDICNELANQIIGTTMPYIPIEYIQVYDNQYINTGIPLFNYNTWKIELDYQPTAVNYQYNGVWGIASGSTSYECWIANSGASYSRYNNTKSAALTLTTARITYTDEFTGSTLYTYRNGTQVRSMSVSTAKTTSTLNLLKCSESLGRARLYRAKLYGNGKLVADYIPALDHKGTACLYEAISETFVYSAGTSEFVAGPITEREAYTTLEYVETASLDTADSIFTGISPSSTIKFQAKLMPKAVSGGSIIGVSGGATSEEKHFRLFNYDEIYYLDYGSGTGGNRIYGGSFPVGTIKELEVGNRYVKDLTTGSNIISGNSVSAFSYNDLEISILSCRIYYLKIWKDGVLVADLIPIRKYDDKLGLLNRVNYEIISVNSNWTAGPVKTE